MTLEIDDSGTGGIIGSAFIGMRRRETNEMLFWELPVYLFDEYGWAVQKPMFKTVDFVIEGLKKIKYDAKESIHLCQGYFFNYLREYFNKNSINPINDKITGNLQEAIEEKYFFYLKKIGFPITQEFRSEYSIRNKALKQWVSKDYQNRLKYVRSGYKKGFNKLLDFIQNDQKIEREQILKFHLQDSILTLENFCKKNNSDSPHYYILIDGIWEMEDILYQSTKLEQDKEYTVGVSVKKNQNNRNYSEKFEVEQQDENAITEFSKSSSFLIYRDAKLKATAKICDILNLEYKPFEESNY